MTTHASDAPAERAEATRGRRWRPWAGLAAVLLVLIAAFFYGARDDKPAANGSDAELVRLRADAALQPCPTGLGPELPDLKVRCLGGGPVVDLQSATSGLPTLVNIWGSWCGPCRSEVPDLVAFATKATGKVAVVGVNTVDVDREALSFAAFTSMQYPSVVDDKGEISRRFGQGTPKTLFLDGQGKIVHVEIGKFDDLAELEALTTKYLGVQV